MLNLGQDCSLCTTHVHAAMLMSIWQQTVVDNQLHRTKEGQDIYSGCKCNSVCKFLYSTVSRQAAVLHKAVDTSFLQIGSTSLKDLCINPLALSQFLCEACTTPDI